MQHTNLEQQIQLDFLEQLIQAQLLKTSQFKLEAKKLTMSHSILQQLLPLTLVLWLAQTAEQSQMQRL